MYRIGVLGAGYVGVVTAACFAKMGHRVVCQDTDATKIAVLREGRAPFYEPDLDDLLRTVLYDGALSFSDVARDAIAGSDVVFLAVGTPTTPSGDADLTYVRQAARVVAREADGPLVVVNKSTVPVETADLVARILKSVDPASRHAVASNPEFLREGSAVADVLAPERIVIGTDDDRARALLEKLYAPFDAPIVMTDMRSAELVKYAANAYLATRLSFVNEISAIADSVGADLHDVLRGISLDPRIGPAYLRAGLGYGGSCLPKDVAALAHAARRHGVEPAMLDAVAAVNRRRILRAVIELEQAIGDLDGARIALFGLAFKADTDDVRESPALALADALCSRGASVTGFDARATAGARRVLRDRIRYADDPYEAAAGAQAIVVAVDDRAFAALDWQRVAAVSARAQVFDPASVLDSEVIHAAGLRHRAPSVSPRRQDSINVSTGPR